MDSWPGTVIAGMAFGVSFSTFAIAEWRNRRARKAERIKNLLGDRSTIAYAALRILDEGLPEKKSERAPVIEAIIHACIFESSDRARALLYQVIDRNRQYRNEFDAALQRVEDTFRNMSAFGFEPELLDLARGRKRISAVSTAIKGPAAANR
ncbi:MAG TPA: hypothetical protein VMB34_30455 [Acetobacteraceae bacterium]|nr:hypothetical protein [Acetobacteraceae bacterium]HUB16303.1 hypothetical protein [Acetobacteraceae bacterium]